MAAGYPSWIKLLREIAEELEVNSKDVHDLAALAQWSLNAHKSDARIKDVINREIGPNKDIPKEAEVIARLPIRHIWTTNFDSVIERAYDVIGRPLQAISAPNDLARKPLMGASRLYKMHGSITNLDDIVISTEDYELFNTKRGAFLPVLESQLTTSSMLFVGISFADPNLRHILSLIRARFQGSGRGHYAIVRPPQRDDFDTDAEHGARQRQHDLWADDLQRYGLHVVEIDSFDEIAPLLQSLERKVAEDRVWISGSWPVGAVGSDAIVGLSQRLGNELADRDMSLVTGYGLVVGSASLAGFLDGLRNRAVWSIAERLIARPFPQPEQTGIDHKKQWDDLRREMAHLAGAVVVIGGKKVDADGNLVDADGVIKEVSIAIDTGKLVIPVGSTGGAAKIVANQLLSIDETDDQGMRVRPKNKDIEYLLEDARTTDEIISKIFEIIKQQ